MANIIIKLNKNVLGGSGEYEYEITDQKALLMIQELINEKLGIITNAAPKKVAVVKSAKKATKTTSAPKAHKSKGGKRAPKGANKEHVLAALRSAGGTTSPSAIAKATGISNVTISQILKKLTTEGTITKSGKGEYAINAG